jgi:excisionase family DNA binding protein
MERGEVEESYLTVAEVAQLLKLNQQTVRNWIDQGSLPALRVGRRVRIKRSDLERVLADGYSAGATAESRPSSPSAEDFWGGEPVGIAEPAPVPVGSAPAPDGTAPAPDGNAPAQIPPAQAPAQTTAQDPTPTDTPHELQR